MTDREVISMQRIFFVLIILVFISSINAQTLYKWTDEKGVVNYSDDYNKIPPAYRNQIKEQKWGDEKKTETPPPASIQAPSQKTEEGTTGSYGQDEAYWRGKVRPWKERLEEASANYARVQRQFSEKSEELSRRKYGSPSQYKFNIIELDRLREEMAKYQSEINEANETLNKISKEAEEAKANPDWLK
jgi:chromosome segregation ATPase